MVREVPEQRCRRCGKRRGTIHWGDMLAFTHGWSEVRCERCVYGPQLVHAISRAVHIPLLVARYLWSLRLRTAVDLPPLPETEKELHINGGVTHKN